MSKSITDIINEALAADQCHGCIHLGTCKHYESLKDAVDGYRLQLAFDSRIMTKVATDKLPPDDPVAEKIIMKHPPLTPIVAIILCPERRVGK